MIHKYVEQLFDTTNIFICHTLPLFIENLMERKNNIIILFRREKSIPKNYLGGKNYILRLCTKYTINFLFNFSYLLKILCNNLFNLLKKLLNFIF